jgi:hypothetical protein
VPHVHLYFRDAAGSCWCYRNFLRHAAQRGEPIVVSLQLGDNDCPTLTVLPFRFPMAHLPSLDGRVERDAATVFR